MEVTSKTQGIILQREPYNENDSRVFVYTKDFGKLELIARGTQKISSKLSAHLEPLNLCEIMIVRGKQYDYLGSAISENIFSGVKSDYNKIKTAGEILGLINGAVKEKQADEQIFLLLEEFLDVLNESGQNAEIIKSIFILKFLALLGYAPDFHSGLMGEIKINKNLADVMPRLLNMKLSEVMELNLSDDTIKQSVNVIKQYQQYVFD